MNAPGQTQEELLIVPDEGNGNGNCLLTSGDRLPLDAVIATAELARRSARGPDYEAENRALVSLAQEMATSPRNILQKLADTALQLCRAHSAGISILEEENGRKLFRWHAVAGQWTGFLGGTMPREISPCGTVLDRNAPQLMYHPARHYPFPPIVAPAVVEVLLVPFHVADQPVGTIWVVAHDESRKFDSEDERVMRSLGTFASSAYQILASVDALRTETAERKQAEEALRRSEAKLRDFVENACVGLHWVGPDGIILWANQTELDLLGYKREEYIGHNIAEFHVDQPVLQDILACLLRGETLNSYEARLRCKDGSIRDVLISSNALFEDGKFIHTRCFTRDITERKIAEAALRENERRFREMIDALPAAIYTTDAEGRLTHFNPAAVEFSGRVPELGTDQWCVSWKLYHADGRPMPHDECPMAIALKEGRAVRGVEAIAERPDGKRIWFTPYPTPLRDAEGKIVGGINMLLDITERKRAEEARARLAAIVESSDDAIISKDLNGIITSWNRGAERIFGYTAEEAIGKPVTILIPLDRHNEEPGILERIRRGEAIDHYETVRRRKDGTLLDISLTVSPIVNSQGHPVGASKIARDITERKRAEEALRAAQQALERQNQSLEQTVEERTAKLREIIAELEGYSYSIVHDMRAPLRGMQAYAQVLRDEYAERVDDTGRRYLGRIAASANRLDRLITDVLAFSRISRREIDLQNINLDRLVEEILQHYPVLREADVEVSGPLGSVRGAEALLTQAIANLLTNAVKFVAIGTKPEIRIWSEEVNSTEGNKENEGQGEPKASALSSFAKHSTFIRLYIQDNGIGIAPKDQQRIFGIFVRVHGEQEYEGTGIGLSIVKKAVERMGGSLGMESKPGKGSTFWVQLPKA
jgi:PAS domain S-box-containing protein